MYRLALISNLFKCDITGSTHSSHLVVSHLQRHLDEGIRTDFAFLHGTLSKLIVLEDIHVQVGYLLYSKTLRAGDPSHASWGQLPLQPDRSSERGLGQITIAHSVPSFLVAQYVFQVTGVLHQVAHYRGIRPGVLSIHTQLQGRQSQG